MKSKIKKFLFNNKWLFLTALISLIVVSVIYITQKIAPFGNNSMLDVDFYHQYGPFLNELYDRVKSGESLLYSFNTGGGIPFYRNFLNYLSSPFNVLLFLFKKENIVMAFSLIILFKVVFASFTMAFFLKKTFKKDGLSLCAFGLMYALSGYFCAYYWNVMWLDGMVFLPLVVYGINKIIESRKPVFYIISLAIMLFSNYFIGYMVCIFSVVYFLGLNVYENGFGLKPFVKNGLVFVGSSLLAAGLVAFALIPLYLSLSSISATSDLFPSFEVSFNVLDYLFNHISGVSRTVFASDALPLPNVYPGLITLVLILAMYFNKSINVRFKIVATLVLLFFFFSFWIKPLDFIWHAFHVPNDLPWRYSFIYVFVLVSLGYYSFTKIKNLSVIVSSVLFGVVILFCLLATKLDFVNIKDKTAIVCMVLLLVYYVIYLLWCSKKISPLILSMALVLFVGGECVYSVTSNWNINHDISTFMADKKPYQDLISYVKKTDNDLYRMEKTNYLTLNDASWYDYYGISTFSSMAYESVSKAQRMLGMGGNNINSYYYQNYQTPVYNTMFNVKYLMGNYIKNDFYVPIKSEESYNVIGYNYSSSLVYMANNDLKNWKLTTYMPFLNQENFTSLATGVTDVFTSLKADVSSGGRILSESFDKVSNGEFGYKLTTSLNELYLSVNNPKEQNIYFYIGGSKLNSFVINNKYYPVNSDEYYVLDAGLMKEGKVEVKLNFEDNSPSSIIFYAYALNEENFKKFYDALKTGFLKVEKYNDSYIKGEITAKNNQFAFTTIAYDEGWRVYVDGVLTDTYKVADAYLGFNVEEGTHEIELKYYPRGMRVGIAVSFISLVLLFIGTYALNRKNKEK